MNAVILAGGNPKQDDLLYSLTGNTAKALMMIAGKPMIQWVLNALNDAKTISHVIIVGLDADCGVNCVKPLTFIPDQGSLLGNARGGLWKAAEIDPTADYSLMLSSDIPGITSEMVDWSVNTSLETNHDIYYSIVSRETMENRFPGSNRSFIRLKDMEVCGGDMNLFKISMATGRDDIWNKLIASRKSVFKQAALIGYDTLFFLLLRQLTLEKLVTTVCERLEISGRALACPYAEVAMDVDKPFQFDILNAYLQGNIKA
jgi:molybdopterin-guanine dinucleotide biosynthesis protein A